MSPNLASAEPFFSEADIGHLISGVEVSVSENSDLSSEDLLRFIPDSFDLESYQEQLSTHADSLNDLPIFVDIKKYLSDGQTGKFEEYLQGILGRINDVVQQMQPRFVAEVTCVDQADAKIGKTEDKYSVETSLNEQDEIMPSMKDDLKALESLRLMVHCVISLRDQCHECRNAVQTFEIQIVNLKRRLTRKEEELVAVNKKKSGGKVVEQRKAINIAIGLIKKEFITANRKLKDKQSSLSRFEQRSEAFTTKFIAQLESEIDEDNKNPLALKDWTSEVRRNVNLKAIENLMDEKSFKDSFQEIISECSSADLSIPNKEAETLYQQLQTRAKIDHLVPRIGIVVFAIFLISMLVVFREDIVKLGENTFKPDNTEEVRRTPSYHHTDIGFDLSKQELLAGQDVGNIGMYLNDEEKAFVSKMTSKQQLRDFVNNFGPEFSNRALQARKDEFINNPLLANTLTEEELAQLMDAPDEASLAVIAKDFVNQAEARYLQSMKDILFFALNTEEQKELDAIKSLGELTNFSQLMSDRSQDNLFSMLADKQLLQHLSNDLTPEEFEELKQALIHTDDVTERHFILDEAVQKVLTKMNFVQRSIDLQHDSDAHKLLVKDVQRYANSSVHYIGTSKPLMTFDHSTGMDSNMPESHEAWRSSLLKNELVSNYFTNKEKQAIKFSGNNNELYIILENIRRDQKRWDAIFDEFIEEKQIDVFESPMKLHLDKEAFAFSLSLKSDENINKAFGNVGVTFFPGGEKSNSGRLGFIMNGMVVTQIGETGSFVVRYALSIPGYRQFVSIQKGVRPLQGAVQGEALILAPPVYITLDDQELHIEQYLTHAKVAPHLSEEELEEIRDCYKGDFKKLSRLLKELQIKIGD